MSASQRNKGKAGEREFLNLLGAALHLSAPLSRNLQQTCKGGADCVQIDGLAIEVKRCERLEVGAWWEQARRQATAINAYPVLAYRQSRKPWTVVVPLAWLGAEYAHLSEDLTASLTIEGFAKVLQHKGIEVAA